MDSLRKDVVLAFRRLVRDPLFAVVAVLTLAIGIGANSAIFTLANGVLLQPLPYPEADRLVYVHGKSESGGLDVLSGPVFTALRERSRTLERVAMFSATDATLTGRGEPEVIEGATVSSSYFAVLGVKPILGRDFAADANQPGADGVVLLSEALWREKFGGAGDVVGSTVQLNGRSRQVVGVMPQSASYPPEWRYWVPQPYDSSFVSPRNTFSLWLNVVGRLKPGATVAQASAEAASIMEAQERAAGMVDPRWTAGAVPLHQYVVGEVRRPLLVLLGAVALVLLIACANLANLLLAQAFGRTTDFAVRRALGASASQLVRQLAVESLVLGAIGGTLGLLLGAWGAAALLALLPPGMPRLPGIHVDLTVVLFTTGISLLASLLFGLAPMLQARRAVLGDALRAGGRGVVSRGSLRTRAALVVAESALAFALVTGAGLLIRTLHQLGRVDPGFRTENTLSFGVELPRSRYDTEAKRALFWRELTRRVAALPGVRSSGAILDLPLAGNIMRISYQVAGQAETPIAERQALDVRVVTPGYFDALRVPLKRGRLFDDRDRAGSQPVAIISQATAARLFPNVDPIGQRLVMGWRRDTVRVQGEVIGVVGDVRAATLRETPVPEIYFPHAQVAEGRMTVIVHTEGEPLRLQRQLAAAVHGLDPDLALSNLRKVDEVVSRSVASDRFIAGLFSGFSALALVLAGIGIFGVISYGVAQRRKELGVRIAVGASRRDVLQLIVQGALRLVLLGVLIGVVGAAMLSRALQSMLFGVAPTDPLTFLTGALVLFAAATAASTLPALRAARTPPASVLTSE